MWAEEFMSSEAYQPNGDQVRIAGPRPSATTREEGAACEGPMPIATVAPSGHAHRLASWLLQALESSTAPDGPKLLLACALTALDHPNAAVRAPAHLGAPPLPAPHTPRRTRADDPCPQWLWEVWHAWQGEAHRGAQARAALHVLHYKARPATAARRAICHHTRVQLLRALAWMRTRARHRGGVDTWRARRLARGAVAIWRAYRNSMTHWAILVTHLSHRHDRAAGRRVLKAWRQHVRLRPLEEQLTSQVHTQCLRLALAHWGWALVRQRRQHRQLLHKTFSAWTCALRLAVKARAVQHHIHRRAKARALRQWRAQLAERRRGLQCMVFKAWREWAHRAKHRRAQAFTALAAHVHMAKCKRRAQAMHRCVCLAKGLGEWRALVGEGRARRRAEAWANTRARHRALVTWVLYTHTYTTQMAHTARAVQHRRGQGMRQALHMLREGRVIGQRHRGAMHRANRGHNTRRLFKALHTLATHARRQALGHTLQHRSRHRTKAALWEHWTQAYTHTHNKTLTHRCVLAWRGGVTRRQWGRQWLRQWHKAAQQHRASKDTAIRALSAWRRLTAKKAARRGVALAMGEQRESELVRGVMQQWAQYTRQCKALTTHLHTHAQAKALRHWATHTRRTSKAGLCLWRAEVWHETKHTTTLLRHWHQHTRTKVLHRWLLDFGTKRLRPRQSLRLLSTCLEGWRGVVAECRHVQWALARATRWHTHKTRHRALHRWVHVVVARQLKHTRAPAPSLLTATRAFQRRQAQQALAALKARVHKARALHARALCAYAAVVAQVPLAAQQAHTLRLQTRRHYLTTHLHAWRHATLLNRLHSRRHRDRGMENCAVLSNLPLPPPSTYTSLHKHKAAHARPQPPRQSPFKPAASTPLQAPASRVPDRPVLASLSRSHPMPGLRSSSYAHPPLHYTRRPPPLSCINQHGPSL